VVFSDASLVELAVSDSHKRFQELVAVLAHGVLAYRRHEKAIHILLLDLLVADLAQLAELREVQPRDAREVRPGRNRDHDVKQLADVLQEDSVHLLENFFIFDKSGDIPVLLVVADHAFQVFIGGRFPVFENGLIPIELILLVFFASEFFHEEGDSFAAYWGDNVVEEVLRAEFFGTEGRHGVRVAHGGLVSVALGAGYRLRALVTLPDERLHDEGLLAWLEEARHHVELLCHSLLRAASRIFRELHDGGLPDIVR